MSAAGDAAKAAMHWQPALPFADVLAYCVAQVTEGKGRERHGGDVLFMQQPWVALARSHTVGFCTGQAEKKWLEARRSVIASDDAWFLKEVAGAINYSLFALILLCDREVADGKISEARAAISAQAWLAGVWPTASVAEALAQQKKPPELPAPSWHDRAVLVRLIQFHILTMARAMSERMASMKPPLAVPPLVFPIHESPVLLAKPSSQPAKKASK